MSIKKTIEEQNQVINSQDKEIKRLREEVFRKFAQIARKNVNESDLQKFRQKFHNMKYIDFAETAISIFSHEGIPENYRNFFNSKQIERNIYEHGKTCLFKWKYLYNNEAREVFYLLPFVGVTEYIDANGNFPIIKPYAPNGTKNMEFPELVVNENCVVFTDFFEFTQTNANYSLTIKEAVSLYTALMADVEVTKKVNRNWTKIPLLFTLDNMADIEDTSKLADDVALQVKAIVEGINDNEQAVVTNIGRFIKTLDVKSQYLGAELREDYADYERQLLNFLGIPNNRYEKKERMVTAEAEKNENEYNLNLLKRKQNREMAIEQAKRIFPELKDWKLKVNIELPSDGEKEEEGGEDGTTDNNAE